MRIAPVLLLLSACSAGGSEISAAIGAQTVVYGKTSAPGSREDAVVLLRTVVEDHELDCSATLVAKNLVVTARHCVAHETEGPFYCTPRGELVDDDTGAGRLGLDLPPETLEFYTGDGSARKLIALGARVISSLSDTACIDDIAFVMLDRDVQLPRLPLRVGQGARAGEAAVLTGYGLDEKMDFGTSFANLRRRTRDDLEVGQVGPNEVSDVESIPPRALLVLGPAGCVGDSGAPLYARETGAVLGVYSLLAGDSCTSTAGVDLFAHASVYKGLIADAFAAAGTEPIAEGELGALGEECGADDECLDGVCADFGDGQERCSRSCARSSDCPKSFACSAKLCALEALPTAGAGGAPNDAGGAGAGGAPNDAGGAPNDAGGGGAPSEGGQPSSPGEARAGAASVIAGANAGSRPTRPSSSGCALATSPAPSGAFAAFGAGFVLVLLARVRLGLRTAPARRR